MVPKVSLGVQRFYLLFLLCSLAPAWARERLQELKLDPHAASFAPGESVRISVPEACWEGAEEGELLLRLPDLHVKAVRLTASQSAPSGLLRFTMPHLPGVRAWFELRVGSGGREWIAARSREFLITPSYQWPITNLVRYQGEWWLTFLSFPDVNSEPGAHGVQDSVVHTENLAASFFRENTETLHRGPGLLAASEKPKIRRPASPQLPFWHRQVALPLLE